MQKAKNFELEFIKKNKESSDTFSFYFIRPKDFDFKPGQYIKLFLDIANPDSRGSSRYFTISSSPTEKEYLALTTKIVRSSFKMKMFGLKPKDKLKAFGPVGYFDFDPKKDKNIVLLAGGIGITPYHSLIKYIAYKKLPVKVTLIASFDHKENVIFIDELKKIQKENSNIMIICTLTREIKSLEFEIGRIDENMIKKYVQTFTFTKFYLTGPQKFTDELYSIIKNLRIPEENIFKEDFPGY